MLHAHDLLEQVGHVDAQLGATDTYTAYVSAASGDDARVEDIGLNREEIERVAIFVADGGGGNPTLAVSTLSSTSCSVPLPFSLEDSLVRSFTPSLWSILS